MSRRRNCHDNAVAESFFQLLKRERIKRKLYNHRDKEMQDNFDYIELFYNSKRRHNSNYLLFPIDFENQFRKTAQRCLVNWWRFSVVGRYILTPRIFHHLNKIQPGSGGEIQLTDGISALLTEEQVLAYRFDGVRYDCGSKFGYLEATIRLGLKHPEVANELRALIDSIANQEKKV